MIAPPPVKVLSPIGAANLAVARAIMAGSPPCVYCLTGAATNLGRHNGRGGHLNIAATTIKGGLA